MKHTLIYSSLSLVISLLLVVLIVHVQGQRSLPDLSPKDQLIFVENFESEESLKKFKIGQADLGHSAGQEDSPAWRIENGQLRAENAHNAALWLKTPLHLWRPLW